MKTATNKNKSVIADTFATENFINRITQEFLVEIFEKIKSGINAALQNKGVNDTIEQPKQIKITRNLTFCDKNDEGD